MNVYEKYVDEIYFNSIKAGIKKHEYRLNIEPLNLAKCGDILRLTSRSKNKESIDCIITSVEVYPDFFSAISKYYEIDFKDLYECVSSAVDACNKFYKADDVNEKGIIVLGIKYLK